jgi:CheY-like chemotaxis protein
VLERLKNDITSRHIPVCVISTDEARARALSSGALAFVGKPVKNKETIDRLFVGVKNFLLAADKKVLVIEPDTFKHDRIREAISVGDVQLTAVDGATAAVCLLGERRVDCLVLSPDLSDEEVLALEKQAEKMQSLGPLPVVVYGEGHAVRDQDGRWKGLAELGPVRRVHSPERLLDQVASFLHQDAAKLPEAKRRILEDLHRSDKVLAGKRALIVDDDMRNIFALSTVLEEHDMVVVSADNGRDAVQIVQSRHDIDIVLMDIMMPEMDGIDTMRAIRKIPELKELPIIAVTAKAMKGDREKCIEAGAWDYLAKPVDTEQLLAVLRAWLHR